MEILRVQGDSPRVGPAAVVHRHSPPLGVLKHATEDGTEPNTLIRDQREESFPLTRFLIQPVARGRIFPIYRMGLVSEEF